MKTMFFVGYDEAYADLAKITVPLMMDYALANRYDFKVYNKSIKDIPYGIYWTTVFGALEAFKYGYERTICLDVDQLIINPEYSIDEHLTNFTHGFHVPRDWGYDATGHFDFSCCLTMAHRDCIPYLEKAVEIEPEWRNKPFPCQGPLRHLAEKHDYPVWVHRRKPWNSVPNEICPGKVVDPWKKGDFMAHITMVPIKQRIKLCLNYI